MHILIFEFNGGVLGSPDYRAALKSMGVTYDLAGYSFDDTNEDEFFTWRFSKLLEKVRYDAVFSVNYFPLIAKCCYVKGIKYLAWSFDCPLNAERVEETLELPTNNVFLFDREHVRGYRKKGFTRVYHLPLAVNAKRLSEISLSTAQRQRYEAEVSFVGKLYESDLPGFMELMEPYDKGYLEAVCNAQTELYGCFLADGVYMDELIERVNRTYAVHPAKPPAINREWLEYEMAKLVARRERIKLIKVLSQSLDMKLYSLECPPMLDKVSFMGTCEASMEAPMVYRCSGISINHTLRCIRSGIPQRALDIMGSKGLLFTNYQPELMEYFENGRELVIYDDAFDALEKAQYFLEHPDEAMDIRGRGLAVIMEHFTYRERFETMFRAAQVGIV